MYLSASCSVLSSTASNELGLAVVDQVLVDAHVLLLGQNSVVGLQTILLEHSLIAVAPSMSKSTAGSYSMARRNVPLAYTAYVSEPCWK